MLANNLRALSGNIWRQWRVLLSPLQVEMAPANCLHIIVVREVAKAVAKEVENALYTRDQPVKGHRQLLHEPYDVCVLFAEIT